jgi:hypothetical protein
MREIKNPQREAGGSPSVAATDEASASSIVQAAQSMRNRGFTVFPVKPDSKEPACYWTDEQLPGITDQDNYGIDCGRSGLVVIDLDGQTGIDSFEALLEAESLDSWPDTFTVQTPHGMHLYFAGSGVGNSAGKLGSNIDVRGAGGYVVGPGSQIDGETYEIDNDAQIADLPAWLAYRLLAASTGNWYGKSLDDLAAEVESARPGSRNSTLNTAAFVAFCNDRIDDDDSRDRLRQAALSAGLGASETDATLGAAYGAAAAQHRSESRAALSVRDRGDLWTPTTFEFLKFSDLSDEPFAYRIQDIMTMQGNLLFSAAAKSGKTSLMMHGVSALTTSADFLGVYPCATTSGRVVYVNMEMPQQLLRKYAVDAGLNLASDKCRILDFRGRAGNFRIDNPKYRRALAEELDRIECEVLIIDPFSAFASMLGVDSDNTDQCRQLLEQITEVGVLAEVDTTIVVDHTGHGDQSRPRNSSAKRDWADMLWNIQGRHDEPRKLTVEGRAVGASVTYLMDPVTKELEASVPADVDSGDKSLILSAIAENPRISTSELMIKSGLDKSVLSKRLKDLETSGEIVIVDPARGPHPAKYELASLVSVEAS